MSDNIPSKYVASCYFSGVFPHKGTRCAKLVGLPGGTKWIPVGKGLALVEPRFSGASYVPADAIVNGEELAKTSLAHFYGLTDGRLYFYPRRVAPVQMSRDWKAFPEDDTLKAGDVIVTTNPGDVHTRSYHLVMVGVIR